MNKQTLERAVSIGGLVLLALLSVLPEVASAQEASPPESCEPLEPSIERAEQQMLTALHSIEAKQDPARAWAEVAAADAIFRCVHATAVAQKQPNLVGRALFRMANVAAAKNSPEVVELYEKVYHYLDMPFFTRPRNKPPFANYAEVALDSMKREGILVRLQVGLCEPVPPNATGEIPCRKLKKPLDRFEIWQDGHEIWRHTSKPVEYPLVLSHTFDLKVKVRGLRYDDTPLRAKAKDVKIRELQSADTEPQVATPALFLAEVPLLRLPTYKNPVLWVGLGTGVSIGVGIILGFALAPPPIPHFVLK